MRRAVSIARTLVTGGGGAVGPALASAWEALRGVPGRGRIFGRLVGTAAPYTGSISPEVVELTPGRAVVAMRDRRGVRNHLRSVHAIALVNLGEAATGLALVTGLPASMRGILVGISMEYVKKARGRITATAEATIPEEGADRDVEVRGVLRDRGGEVVAIATARWRVGPVRRR